MRLKLSMAHAIAARAASVASPCPHQARPIAYPSIAIRVSAPTSKFTVPIRVPSRTTANVADRSHGSEMLSATNASASLLVNGCGMCGRNHANSRSSRYDSASSTSLSWNGRRVSRSVWSKTGAVMSTKSLARPSGRVTIEGTLSARPSPALLGARPRTAYRASMRSTTTRGGPVARWCGMSPRRGQVAPVQRATGHRSRAQYGTGGCHRRSGFGVLRGLPDRHEGPPAVAGGHRRVLACGRAPSHPGVGLTHGSA